MTDDKLLRMTYCVLLALVVTLAGSAWAFGLWVEVQNVKHPACTVAP